MDLFSVVSVDMFETLINVMILRHRFWREVLGEDFSDALVDKYSGQWRRSFLDHFNRAVKNTDCFMNLNHIFESYWRDFFRRFAIDCDPEKAVQIHFAIHRAAPPFEDTQIFLDSIQKKFPICLVTDSDNEMILPHLAKYNFDRIFISERLKAYKSDPRNRMFNAVISHYKIPSERIFHIGDMYSDISGANKAGITTCWLNRGGVPWNHSIKPDYEVRSLLEAAAILGCPLE